MFSVVSVCVLNQFHGHWLFFNALNMSTIITNLKLKKKIGISSNLENLIDDDFVVALELSFFTSNIKRAICGVFYVVFFHSPRKI